jgi:hypothetical protein
VDDLGLAAFDAVLQAAAEFDQALRQRDLAGRRAEEVVLGSEKQLRQALGGTPLARWRRLVGADGPIRTSHKGRQIHLARARRHAVEAALENLAQLQTSQSAKLAAADAELAEAARRLLRYGPAASALCGWPLAELRRVVGCRPASSTTPARYRTLVPRGDLGG